MNMPALGLDNCLASKLSVFHAANNRQVQYVPLHVQGLGVLRRGGLVQQILIEDGITKYEMGQFDIHMILF